MRRDRKHEKDNEMDASRRSPSSDRRYVIYTVRNCIAGRGNRLCDTIASAEDLVLLADSGKTENFPPERTFVMTEDIDLSEYENMFIPIMDGTFDGGGHTITGIRLQEEMSDYGFFRYVGPNGTVANLTVEATVTSGEEQENIGIIAGDNKGTTMAAPVAVH